jgi:lipoprotein-anchoring transpeptidase ErfK/SrfK
MRRLVGISAKSAVAVALGLAAAIYLEAEDKQLVVNTADGPQVITLRDTKSGNPKSGDPQQDRVIGSSDHRANEPRAASPAAPARVEPQSQGDELAAEQQAALIPAQDPPKKTAKDVHTRKIVISIPDRQLALLEDGQLVTVYPVAVGKTQTPSPAGEFTIINHAVNPTWRHDGQEIGPGKNNPLGTRWMGLSAKGYGIHGTNVQSSVGTIASHGCFRMKKKDVEELYKQVQVGDAVSIRGERDELTAGLFGNDVNAAKKETEVASATTVNTAAGADQ